ncbi:uncharacterized protein LOC131875906 [Cryptomeria japonica]|uniref:uncharacterized protein LOC131875906 n=1 Tax=Cryptomeria japonica TaxID=3369 RepID=UPI0027DA21EF|nr:uncharacterized protein LOC131875906 [Cryptomeria japonica]
MKVEWAKPKNGWFKINFDGASKGNPSPSGVGFVTQDWEGNIIALGATKLSEGTNNGVKAQAAIEAIKMVEAMDLQKNHLEGDSQMIINAISKGEIHVWKLNKFVSIAKSILETFDDYEVCHMVHLGNELVDRLSNWALSFNDEGRSTIKVFNDLILDTTSSHMSEGINSHSSCTLPFLKCIYEMARWHLD